MRNRLVTVSWCLLGLLFPVTVNYPNAAAQDATAYQEACGDCHPAPAALARKIKGATEEEKKAYLTAFLTHHHPPDPETIGKIAGFLFSLPKR